MYFIFSYPFLKNKACGSRCDKCQSSTKCTECTNPYYVCEGNCIDSCPTGYYADTASTV